MFRNPRPSDEVLAGIYSASYFLGDGTPPGKARREAARQAAARLYLRELVAYRGAERGELLDLGCRTGDLLLEAQRLGFEVAGQEVSPEAVAAANGRLGREAVRCGSLDRLDWDSGSFDVCVLTDVIERVAEPLELLRHTTRLLRPGGTLLLVTPSLENWSGRLPHPDGTELALERLTFFTPTTLTNALAKAGFRNVRIDPSYAVPTPEPACQRVRRLSVPVLPTAADLSYRLIPPAVRERRQRLAAGGMLVLARAAGLQTRPLLSIIVPVYNERRTFPELMEGLLEKELPGLDREIIIVESNSTDGTREQVLRYRDRSGLRVVLEPRPRGKGHAVRTGLALARGDYVLIQDADLEYDLNDYDALLEPLVNHQAAFVLGTRHGGRWKMRRFSKNPGQALLMNLGHVFFTWLVNTLYGQQLKDPFTMFKVFRRDCLSGLELEQDRFGFDFELVIKLVRNGYTPVEIPVNYQSRSFAEGKKVRMVRDPLEWLWVAVKYRLPPRERRLRRVRRGRDWTSLTRS